MTDEEFQIVKMCVDEILTEDTSRQRVTMNGTISQLHKGGGTNKTSDQRPVALLNSVYQLLNYVINERLKKIVEPANILEPGQGGGGKDVASALTCKRCTSSNRKLGDRAREFIESPLTLQTPSTLCLKQRSGSGALGVSFTDKVDGKLATQAHHVMQITSEHTSNFAASMQETVAKNQELEKQVEQFMAAASVEQGGERGVSLYGLIVEHFGRWVCSHERPARQEAPGVPRQCSRAVDTCGELQAKNSTLQVQTQHTQQFPQTVFSVRESRQATITQQGNNTFVGNFATCGDGGGVTGSMHSMHSVQHTMGYRPQQEQQMPFWEAQSPSGSFQVGGMLGMTSDGGSQ
eukprot:CAMPEP_0179453250 /NCGR_PEP_ID=MMETSP0799-20121207/37190_1 /TAXON_ID=46947 /ORGANISM="Geminigera cryophila, Strain CCMP2564" /LENGTH=347 /DNA_ID=CAMNT_0021250093 /DNA_START=271 /DNA_END=1312 /DNA_ORIENTATION=+